MYCSLPPPLLEYLHPGTENLTWREKKEEFGDLGSPQPRLTVSLSLELHKNHEAHGITYSKLATSNRLIFNSSQAFPEHWGGGKEGGLGRQQGKENITVIFMVQPRLIFLPLPLQGRVGIPAV